mgnify:CR=1 FL=1
MSNFGTIQPSDILDRETYKSERKKLRNEMVVRKKNRRIEIGPHITVYFENRSTILHQINEMVYIEDGGIEQVKEEIGAYKSLVPNGKELIITLMVEIDNPIKRAEVLKNLGGVEEKLSITFGDKVINGKAELDGDRTTADGKASSVQFIHFNFTQEEIDVFNSEGTKARIEINHTYYQHMSGITEAVREELKGDFIS